MKLEIETKDIYQGSAYNEQKVFDQILKSELVASCKRIDRIDELERQVNQLKNERAELDAKVAELEVDVEEAGELGARRMAEIVATDNWKRQEEKVKMQCEIDEWMDLYRESRKGK